MDSETDLLAGEAKPSVDSDDPNERKLARRNRVKARLEAAERAKAIADGTYVEPAPEKPLIHEVIETSEDTLNKLYLEGKEQVTNIIVASDSKEVERREAEVKEKNDRAERLREEAALAMERLDEISEKWNMIMETTGPLELHQRMNDQKARCLELIEQKNALIKNFQMELKMADEKFMKNRKTMYEELSLLTRRIDDQVLIMKKAYRVELENIEESVDKTRSEIIEKHQKTWQSLYKKRETDEVKNMKRKFDLVENFHESLHQLHIGHEESYREMKIQLETDVQTLEQELQHLKALCLLNSEKLDYNYQILKKREEENLYIRNHQKRRLNKLQDMMNMLKKKVEEKRQATEDEFKKLTNEVHRYYANVLETEKKAYRFMQVNEDKFQNIWDMKDEEAKELLDQILKADRIIYEEILGLPWIPPPVTVITKSDIPSYRTAYLYVKEQKPEEDGKSSEKTNMQVSSSEALAARKRILRRIMEAISSRCGFLIEERLDQLLQPYTEDEKTFVRLDNVFVAIGIHTEKDIEELMQVFLPYAVCLQCERKTSIDSVEVFEETQKSRPSSRVNSVLQIRELEEKVSKLRIQAKGAADNSRKDSSQGSRQESPPSQKEVFKGSKKEGSPRTPRSLDQKPHVEEEMSSCDITHPLVVEKYNVLKALRDFVSMYRGDRLKVMAGIEEKLHKKRFTISRLLSLDEINSYWKRYKQLLPEKLEITWTGIYGALTRYLIVLKDRHKLNLEAQALRRQNRELKRLLSLYKTAQNRHELTLPVIPSIPDGPIDFAQILAISQKLSL